VRAPWADEFVGVDIPARVMISHGWRFECCDCGDVISEDCLDENDLTIEGVIGSQHSRVFCSEICEAKYNLDRAIARDHERRMIGALKTYVLTRFPGVTVETARSVDGYRHGAHAYATSRGSSWQIEEASVSFEFPGQKIAPATCELKRSYPNDKIVGPLKPEFSCCFGDLEAFEAWARPKAKAQVLEESL
jgi:hypothetical protein